MRNAKRKERDLDEEWFLDVMNQYQERVERRIYNIVKDQQHTDALVNRTWTQLWRKGYQLRESGKMVGSWLFRTATNEALMFLRHEKTEAHPLPFIPEDEEEILVTINELTPERIASAREELERALRVCEELEEHERVVLKLCDFQGLSNPECAAVINASSGPAQKSRVFRARARFLAKIKREESRNERAIK